MRTGNISSSVRDKTTQIRVEARKNANGTHSDGETQKLLNALPHAILAVAADGFITEANLSAEMFFGMSRAIIAARYLWRT